MKLWTVLLCIFYVSAEITDSEIQDAYWSCKTKLRNGNIHKHSVPNALVLIDDFLEKQEKDGHQYDTCVTSEIDKTSLTSFNVKEFIRLVRSIENCLKGGSVTTQMKSTTGTRDSYTTPVKSTTGTRDSYTTPVKSTTGTRDSYTTPVRSTTGTRNYINVRTPDYAGNLGWTSVHFANIILKNDEQLNADESEVWSPFALELTLAGFFSARYSDDLDVLHVIMVSLFAANFTKYTLDKKLVADAVKEHYRMIQFDLKKENVSTVLEIYYTVSSLSTHQLTSNYMEGFNTEFIEMSDAPTSFKELKKELILSSDLTISGSWSMRLKPVNDKIYNHLNLEVHGSFMRNTGYYNYLHNKRSFKIIDLPIDGVNRMSLLIFLPYGNLTVADLENQLAVTDWLATVKKEWTKQLVRVTIPKFRLQTTKDFKSVLTEGLNLEGNLQLGKVQYEIIGQLANDIGIFQDQTFMVDELGINTEASKQTANATVSDKSDKPQQFSVDFQVNRPFMFALVHMAKFNTVLLQGHLASFK